MKYLFKEKRYRPLGVLIVALLLYLILFVVSIAFSLTTDHDPLKDVTNWYGIGLNGFTLVFCVVMWRRFHLDSIQREQRWIKQFGSPVAFSEQELQNLEKIGIATKYLSPVNYKRDRRQNSWMWSGAIFVNLLSLSTHFW